MRPSLAGIAAAVVAVLAGCSTTVSGSVAMTTAPAPAGAVDLALLDPGNYPTKPRPPLGTAGDTHNGAFLEGARMGANVVGPWEVDPTLLAYPHAGEKPSDFAEAVGVAAVQAAQAHRLVALFTSSRAATGDDRSLANAVLRFPSPEEAATAVTEMTEKSANAEVLGEVIAHGPYVLAQYANSKESPEAAAELIAATLDKQGPPVDQFQPTPIDQLKNLPIDPDGLLARTLPPSTGNGAVYGPRTQLHFDSDPLHTQTTFDDAQLQQMAKGKSGVGVYQTPDAASAQKIADGFAADIGENGFGDGKKFVPAAGIKGLPTAKCLVHKDTKATESYYYCLAVADRYAIEVSTAQELDAHQLVSAQYLMLTAN